MKVLRTLNDLAAAYGGLPRPLGLVATMGSLHAGHRALVAASRARCAGTIASIFVNPAQFNDAADFSAYPRSVDEDLAMLAQAGCDAVWLPDVATMFPPGGATVVEPAGPALGWEGDARPGHFRGMATVVAKLFGQLRPDMTFFGEKDWQQLQVVRRLAADLFLPVAVVGVPTVREPDGLAMSSRNQLLSPAERAVAPLLHQCMVDALAGLHAGNGAATGGARARLPAAGFVVDYLELVDAATLVRTDLLVRGRLIAAARLGRVRLLDNLAA